MQQYAIDYFRGRRGNCAQAVCAAWNQYHDTNHDVDEFQKCGGGRAPEGMCGALHAARTLAGERAELVITSFRQTAGGEIRCRNIRGQGGISCLDCVGEAANLLQRLCGRLQTT